MPFKYPEARRAWERERYRKQRDARRHFLDYKSRSSAADPIARGESESRDARLRREHAEMVEQLREARAREEFNAARDTARPPVIFRRELASGLREATAVVLASDWHVEEIVDPVMVAGRNKYTLDIADRRIERFFRGVLWLCDLYRGAFQVRDLVLWLGGDLMTGWIHEELQHETELSPIETSLWLEDRVAAGIALLLASPLERIVVPCSYGNHGRTGAKMRHSGGAKTSYEWLMYQHLARRFAAEPRLSFHADQSAHQYVTAYGFDLHFHHGHDVKYYGGVGGLSIPLNKAIPMWDRVKPAHYHHIGHFHQYLDLGAATCNGSLIGFSAYAMAIKAAFEPPQQAFYLLDSKRGKTCCSPIWVSE